MRSLSESSFEHVTTWRDVTAETGRDIAASPSAASARSTSRSDTRPTSAPLSSTTASAPTPARAMRSTAERTEAPGHTVRTFAPFARRISVTFMVPPRCSRLSPRSMRRGEGPFKPLFVAFELQQAAGAERADAAIDVELAAAVLDVEVAHRQLPDAVEGTEGRVVDLLHAQSFRSVGEVRSGGIEDAVVVAAAQANDDFAGDGRTDPSQQRLAQHQALRIEPAALVEQASQPTAHRAVVLLRSLVVDAGQEALVADAQQGEPGRFVDAAALRFDDAVLDLVAHAEAVTAADRIRLKNEIDLGLELVAVERDGPPLGEADRDLLGRDADGLVVVGDPHDRLDDVHAGREFLQGLRFVGGTPDVGVGAVRLVLAVAVRQVAGDQELAHLGAAAE